MNSRLGLTCLAACALIALAAAGCSHKSSSVVATPTPSPSPSVSPAADTLYVQTSTSGAREIRAYIGASALNGLAVATRTYPTSNSSNGDVIYYAATDSLWFATAYSANFGPDETIETWDSASQDSGMLPNVLVPFQYGEGVESYDSNHHLLFVATESGPQVSVYTNPQTMTASSTPAAIITMQLVDGQDASPRPQEMLYDPYTDRMFVSDQGTEVAVFDGFGSAAEAAVVGQTNPTIPPNRYMTGLFSPDGLAYSHSSDVLFIGEQQGEGFLDVIHNASTFNGAVGHAQEITGFAKPGGLAYDDTVRNLLFVYDGDQFGGGPIYVIPNAITASGAVNSIVGLHTITDASGSANAGFGLSLDTSH
jgi:hypothetical protein